MKLTLHEIQYTNIREMKDLTINLCDSEKPVHVSLVQMPNGVGKTTTMELIRYCLDGTANNLDKKKILSFKPPGRAVKTGKFEIKISVDNKIRIVSIKFDYEKATVTYFTSKTSTKGGGQSRGLNLGREIEPWLKDKDFVRLFVFDGELAGQLLSSESTSAEKAINALYLLNSLKNLFEDDGEIDQLLNDVLTEGAQTDKGIKNLSTRLRNAHRCKKKLDKLKADLTKKLGTVKWNIGDARDTIDKLRKKTDQLIRRYEKLISENSLIEKEIESATEDLMDKMRFPHNLSDKLVDQLKLLATQMGTLKLPKTQSMEFFEELAESKECVCGRPIGKKEKEQIKLRAKEFLTENNIGVINGVKTAIRNLPAQEKMADLVKIIKKNNRLKKLNERKILALDKKTKDKDKIKELTETVALWRIDEKECADQLIMLTEKRKEEQEIMDVTWETNIDLCINQIEDWQNKLAEAKGNVDFKNKAMLLKEILKQIHTESVLRLKKNILCKTNDKIEKILKSKDITISKIGNCLSLTDRSGVSEGQKLSIAYAFLSTLFSESPHHLPFIVDTPAAPLDLQVRREVAETLPSLFTQIVVFLTSGERKGFADRFYSKKSGCLFYTVSKSGDGVKLEKDITFFKNFQSEE